MRHLFPLLVLIAACVPSAQRVGLAPGVVIEPGQVLAVWHADTADTLRAVQVTDSLVTGIPYSDPVECDSCRVTWPLAEIDSATDLASRRDQLMPGALSAAAVAAFAGIWIWSSHK
jgi:hypothetical protein